MQPLIVRDNWIQPELLSALDAMWPLPTSGLWHAYDSGKMATKTRHGLPRAAELILDRMAELPIGDLLGIHGTFPDLDHLHGSGLHQLHAGQELGLHIDAERHPLLPWRREVSAVLYLDDSDDGGRLELLDYTASTVVSSVTPKRGRLAVFRTPGQWHRVSRCGSLRRSVCLFFWRIDKTAQGNATAYFK